MSVFIEIKNCEDCPYKSHTGGFTIGGAKPCCNHSATITLKGSDCFKRVIPHNGVTKEVKGIPKWCPLPTLVNDTIDYQMLDNDEILGKTIIDVDLYKDNDGEELQILLSDGKQIEICLLDNGRLHVQSD